MSATQFQQIRCYVVIFMYFIVIFVMYFVNDLRHKADIVG